MQRKEKETVNEAGRHWHKISFVLYLALLCYFLFFAEAFGRTEPGQEYHYNLILFKEIGRFWTNRRMLGFWPVFCNIAGNVIAFLPYGFFLPAVFSGVRGTERKLLPGMLRVLLLSLLLSLFVEVVQLVSKVGSFDVDDLLLNTSGGLLGYMLYFAGRHLRRHKD